jgi:elongation factor G
MRAEPFVIEVGLDPRSDGDREKLAHALQRLLDHGISFGTSLDVERGQTFIQGTDEIHLEIIVRRLLEEFEVKANVGAPQVAYRETITKTKEQDTTHKKQTGGAGQFARVKIRFEALPAGAGFVFENQAPEESVPAAFVAGVASGLERARESGVVAGFPVIDFMATLIDGAYHDIDSNVMTFDIAARACFRAAIPQAGPKLLEPMMKVEVATPEDCLGDVIGDLNSRRGQVLGMDSRGAALVVTAMVPLANMFGYVNKLHSMSQGRAQYTMTFDHYEQVPLLPPNGGDDFPGAMALG